MLSEERYIGLALAIGSSVCIGSHAYGMAIGEIGNFTAYAFAPAILVTPLGAISVIVGAILGSYFLQETLGILGKLGSSTCLMGALIIVLHVQPDEEIETIDQFLDYAIQPGFLLYITCVIAFSLAMVYKIAPAHGRKTPLIYISICSVVGSVSVMSTKAFGIALKLTFSGENQFTHPSTYIFMMTMVACILTQLNYFNKALSIFPLNIMSDAASTDIVSGIETSMTRHQRSIRESWDSSMTNDRETRGLNAAFEAEIDSRT
ncbi:hypothetical protein G7Z17_g4687 [Cylindrodendrum hubeiense]|uniref:Magnesium transporter n=1 Tax=Cylindrodendrum hubeiense TaxID=595255 RepID=A0A9P5HGH1_9HYPO|nr:hypothetical protein G7Z17_g4687 [Cylindrodendrum hubeiense]